MVNRFTRSKPSPPYTFVGAVPPTEVCITMQSRLKLVVRVPESRRGDGPGSDLTPDDCFEQDLRRQAANALLGLMQAGFDVLAVTVEQFEDAGG